jgi:hypothetical protein
MAINFGSALDVLKKQADEPAQILSNAKKIGGVELHKKEFARKIGNPSFDEIVDNTVKIWHERNNASK